MNLRTFAIVLSAAALGACAKGSIRDITAPISGARIKFFNFAVATPPATMPSVNFYADGVKQTAITSGTGVESTTGTAAGGVGNGGFYTEIVPGTHTITGRVSATTDNGLAIATLPTTLVDGKIYSFYMSGIYNPTTKLADSFIIQDDYPETPSTTLAYVRYVNASSNTPAATLYAKNTVGGAEIPVGGDVAYKAGGAFVTMPEGVYDLRVTATGSATNVVTRAAVSFLAGRVYTIGVFGDATVGGTTAANRIRLDNTLNR